MRPEDELFNNLDMISPVKRCPGCNNLSLSFDEKSKRIFCNKCAFQRFLPK